MRTHDVNRGGSLPFERLNGRDGRHPSCVADHRGSYRPAPFLFDSGEHAVRQDQDRRNDVRRGTLNRSAADQHAGTPATDRLGQRVGTPEIDVPPYSL